MAGEDDFFAENEDGADDNLAPDRFRTTTKSRKVTSEESGISDDDGKKRSSSSKAKARAPSVVKGVHRSLLLPDEVGRLPALPDFSKFKLSDIPGLIQFGLEFITRNGQTTYKTPIPPPSDVNELEYVSALHQCSSMAELRQDCSIHAEEIGHFLKSRHGLCVTPEVVRKCILQGMLCIIFTLYVVA